METASLAGAGDETRRTSIDRDLEKKLSADGKKTFTPVVLDGR
jgi:hypothetical protein